MIIDYHTFEILSRLCKVFNITFRNKHILYKLYKDFTNLYTSVGKIQQNNT